MIDAAAKYRHAVVIGGGLLGLEAANGLKLRGMDVTVVHIMPWLMERQLDDTAGKLLQKSLEDRGLKFLIGAQTEALLGDSDVCAAVPLQGRHRDPGRPGGDGRRHPPEHRAGRSRRPALSTRHRRHRHPADRHRPAHLRRRRMRRAPRHRLRAGGAAVRAGQGLRHAPGAVRHRPLQRQPDQHQAQGHRHRPVLGRRLHRRRRAARRSCCPIRSAASTRSW